MGAEFDSWVRTDLDLPTPKLVKRPDWRWSGDHTYVEMPLPNGKIARERDWVADVMLALEAGRDFRAMVARFAETHPEERHLLFADQLVRQYLLDLHNRGVVDLQFPMPPPTLAAGRYHPERLLGTGGFGCAWLALDAKTGERIVVKRAWSYFHRAPVANETLAQEAAILRKLDHPGVARLYEQFTEDGRVHLVREFVDGHDIMHGRRSAREICADVVEVARIVEHAHQRGLLMLDLGPTNFYRRAPDGRIVAIDMGLCVAREGETTRLTRVSGSRGYTSPEVREQRLASVRSDVWSLGALAFALWARRLVSSKWSDADVAREVAGAPLAEALRACLALDPHARPATMRDAARLFEEAAARAA